MIHNLYLAMDKPIPMAEVGDRLVAGIERIGSSGNMDEIDVIRGDLVCLSGLLAGVARGIMDRIIEKTSQKRLRELFAIGIYS